MSRIRVLHVIEAMHQGGAESMVVEHVRRAAPGIESLVCALNRGGPALEQAAAAGARTFVLGKGDRRWGGLKRLTGLMRAEGVTVVNGHNPTGGLYAAFAGVAARIRVIVRTEHSVHYSGRHSRLYSWLVEPLATACTRRIVCVCEAVRESHVRRLPWAAGRLVVVRNGVSAVGGVRPRDRVRGELGLRREDAVALTVGALAPQKAHHVLLDAFVGVAERLPTARLLVAGDGPLREALEQRVRANGTRERVSFLGARGDVGDLLEAADLFVLSSLREGLPVTLLEAMRAGRAVVATAVGGNPEAVEDGASGRLVSPADAGALAEAMWSLLSDQPRATVMGAVGRERWARLFDAERMVRETEALYQGALQGAGGDTVVQEGGCERHSIA